MKKIAFLGSKGIGFSSLKFLLDHTSMLDIEIVAVFSNDRKISKTDPSIMDLAKSHSIPVFQDIDKIIELPSFELLISVQYHEILHQKHIDCAQELAINLHMAPLPEYRGCNQFSFAIIEGAEEFGTTLHVMEAGIDSGDILFERRFPILDTESVQTLHQKTTMESIQLFEDSIAKIIQGNYQRQPQSKYKGIRASGFHLRNEMDSIKQIDSTWPEEKIDRYIRATYFPPFAPPFTVIKGQKFDLSPNWRNEIPR